MSAWWFVVGGLVLGGWYVWHTYGQVIDLMWPRDDEDHQPFLPDYWHRKAVEGELEQSNVLRLSLHNYEAGEPDAE